MMEVNETVDVVVVGGGIAGSAIAWALGKQGRKKVLVIERSLKEPETIVGELMQPAGMEALRSLGLGHCLDGIDAIDVNGYSVYYDGQFTPLPYPDGKQGRSFHHGRFVMQLRKAASTLKNVELREAVVTGLIEEDDAVVGVMYKQNEVEKRVYAPFVVACDGRLSRLRSGLVAEKPLATSNFYGIVLHNMTLPHPNHGHVFLLDPAPVLAYQIGSNDTRLLVDVPYTCNPNDRNFKITDFLLNTTAPQLPQPVRDALIRELTDAKGVPYMPNAKLHPAPLLKKGVVLIGDALNMRHPLTGGGMTVALSDVVILRDILGKYDSFEGKQDQILNDLKTQFFTKRTPLAETINMLAGALYEIFAATSDPALRYMRQAVLDYFKRGGGAVQGPITLLSGLDPSPTNLIRHYLLVATYGAWNYMKPFPTFSGVWKAFQLWRAALSLSLPLLGKEHWYHVGIAPTTAAASSKLD